MATKTLGNEFSSDTASRTLADNIRGIRVTADRNGLALSITARMTITTANKTMRGALYNSDNNTFIAATEEKSIDFDDVNFQEVTWNFPSKVRLKKGTSYLIVLWSEAVAGLEAVARDTSKTGEASVMNETYTGTFPTTFTPSDSTDYLEIYCTYQLIGGGNLSLGNSNDRN